MRKSPRKGDAPNQFIKDEVLEQITYEEVALEEPKQAAVGRFKYGSTVDRCSGQLWVRRLDGDVEVRRGEWYEYSTRTDSNGYFFWWCDDSFERSRVFGGSSRPVFIQVLHDSSGRKISWHVWSD
jgi:hypothetical protein